MQKFMKRVLTISILAVLALFSCHKEELNYQTVETKTFIASTEDATKTILDGHNVLWKKGNQVSIFDGFTINEKYQVTDASDGKTEAKLTPIEPSGYVAGTEIDNNISFYPYSSTTSITRNESAYIISGITLPATQNYAIESFGDNAFPMAAVTKSTTDLNLKFKNVLGGLKLQLIGTAIIKSISVTGNNNEILCGTASVTASNRSTPTINLIDESAKIVTLDCGDGVELNTSTATSFVIALPPVTMTGGFSVVIIDTDGKMMKVKTTKSQTIDRTTLLKMPVVNYEGVTTTGNELDEIEFLD